MIYDAVILLGLLIVASAVALPFGEVNKVAFHDFWFTLWLLVVCLGYFTVCWRYAGMTVGMRAWKVKLRSGDGQPLTWRQCLTRGLVGIVSLLVFGLGVLWVLIDRKNRGWHDLASGTELVRLP